MTKETGVIIIGALLILSYDIYSLFRYPSTGLWNVGLNVCIFWLGFVVYDLYQRVVKEEITQWWYTGRCGRQTNKIQEMEEGQDTGEQNWEVIYTDPRERAGVDHSTMY